MEGVIITSLVLRSYISYKEDPIEYTIRIDLPAVNYALYDNLRFY